MDFNSIRADINNGTLSDEQKAMALAGIDDGERIYLMRQKAVRWMSKLTLDVLEAVNYDQDNFIKQVENGNFAEEFLRRVNG